MAAKIEAAVKAKASQEEILNILKEDNNATEEDQQEMQGFSQLKVSEIKSCL